MGAHTASSAASSVASSRAEDDLQARIDLEVKAAVASARLQLVDDLIDWANEHRERVTEKHLEGLRGKYNAAFNKAVWARSEAQVKVEQESARNDAKTAARVKSEEVSGGEPPLSKLAAKRRRAKERKRERERQAREEADEIVDQMRDVKIESTASSVDKRSEASDDTAIPVPKSKWERRNLIEDTVDDLTRWMPIVVHPDEWDRQQKLLIWQGLCLELGLAGLGKGDERPEAFEDVRFITKHHFSRNRPPYTLYSTNYELDPLPLTANACNKLLHSRGHVNILEYCAARRERVQQIERHRHQVGDEVTDDMLCPLNNQGAFAHLVQPSAGSMVWDSTLKRNIVKRNIVKENWFDPLMRHFH